MRTPTVLAPVCLLCLTILFAMSCNAGELSDQEAISLIRQSEGYPKLKSLEFPEFGEDVPMAREIQRLVRDGFLVPGCFFDFCTPPSYKPTEKGKDLLEGCTLNTAYHKWDIFKPYTYRIDVKRITDKRIDKAEGDAIVMYELVYTPTPYLDQLRNVDAKLVDAALRQAPFLRPDALTQRAHFEKWEKGWRITKY